MTGVDLTQINGLNETSVLKILAETGVDISPWSTEKHFASWLGLSPGNKITGGKILSSKTKPCANRAAAIGFDLVPRKESQDILNNAFSTT